MSLKNWSIVYPDSGTVSNDISIRLYTDPRSTTPDHARAAAVQALLDAATLELVKRYANQLTEWTSTEESDLAKISERQTISAFVQKACRDGELVLFKKRKRGPQDDEALPGDKKVAITIGVHNTVCSPDAQSEWELVGGIVKARADRVGAEMKEISDVDITDLIDLPSPGTPAVSLNSTGSTLERRQFRHYMLDLAGSMQSYFDKDTAANADSMVARIKEQDASSTRTLSIARERKTDFVDALNTVHNVIFCTTDIASAPPVWKFTQGSSVYVFARATAADNFSAVNVPGVGIFTITENNFTASLTCVPDGLSDDVRLLTINNLHRNPSVAPLTSGQGYNLYRYLNTYDLIREGDTDPVSVFRNSLNVKLGTPAGVTTKEGECVSVYSKQFYELAVDSHHKDHITVRSAKDAAHLFTDNAMDTQITSSDEKLKTIENGIELVPITESEIELFTTGEAVETVHFCTSHPGEDDFKWAIGGCATTLLDGAAAAVAYLQYQFQVKKTEAGT